MIVSITFDLINVNFFVVSGHYKDRPVSQPFFRVSLCEARVFKCELPLDRVFPPRFRSNSEGLFTVGFRSVTALGTVSHVPPGAVFRYRSSLTLRKPNYLRSCGKPTSLVSNKNTDETGL